MFILDGTQLKRPTKLSESDTDQYAQVRTLANTIGRDYFGALGKRVWTLDYVTTTPSDYAVAKAIRDSFRSTATPKTWQVTEANYTVASVLVLIDLVQRKFSVGGTTYLSDYSLILTEV